MFVFQQWTLFRRFVCFCVSERVGTELSCGMLGGFFLPPCEGWQRLRKGWIAWTQLTSLEGLPHVSSRTSWICTLPHVICILFCMVSLGLSPWSDMRLFPVVWKIWVLRSCTNLEHPVAVFFSSNLHACWRSWTFVCGMWVAVIATRYNCKSTALDYEIYAPNAEFEDPLMQAHG